MTKAEAIKELEIEYLGDTEAIREAKDMAIEALKSERKIGKWGDHGECPFCSYLRQWENDRFCGNCGADMRGAIKCTK